MRLPLASTTVKREPSRGWRALMQSTLTTCERTAAGVHGWLAAYKHADQTAMNQEIEIYKRMLNRSLELEPSNPRALWIQAVPYLVLPPERGGNVDRAIELYRKMIDNAAPLRPESPLPDWGKVEGMMSLSFAYLKKPSPDVNAAEEEARATLRLPGLALRSRHSDAED